MIRKLYACLVILLFSVSSTFGQAQRGEIRGVIKDAKTKQPLDFVQVAAFLQGYNAGGTVSDLDGKYSITALTPGKYTIKVSYVGYNPVEFDDVLVKPDQITFLDIEMDEAVTEIQEVVKKVYKNPIIRADDNGKTLDGDQIKKVPSRNANTIANMGSGVFSLDGGTPSFRGSRPSGTAYYINGVRVIGSVTLPQNGIGQTNVITGGIPAEYGDFTGGAISISTPAPSSKFNGVFEGITSSLFNKYHYNQFETMLTGPLYIKNKGKQNERAVLGYLFSGNFQYHADYSPSAIGVWTMKPNDLKAIEETPLRPSPVGSGFVPTASFVTQDQLQKVQAKQNTPQYRVNAVFNMTYAPNDRVNILFGGTYNYVNQRNYNFQNSLFNSNNNQQYIQNGFLSYLILTQKLISPADPTKKQTKKRIIDKAFYTISLQYQSTWTTSQDAVHQNNIWDYGYYGKYKTYSRPEYQLSGTGDGPNAQGGDMYVVDGDTVWLKNYYKQVGITDTLYTFDRTPTKNPILSNYTSNYYDYVGGNVQSFSQVRGSAAGLVNGQSPVAIYSNMWVNAGTVISGYTKSQQSQYSLNAIGEASILGHDLKFGIYYEQRIYRGYSVGAGSLWQLAWQYSARLGNGMKLDQSNPLLQYDQNGVFTNTVNFNAKVDPATQSTFDKNFRQYLIEHGKVDSYGNLVNENTVIDVNSYDPTDLKLKFFSADELLNNGNSVVSYYGYDYLGNVTRGKKKIEAFTDDALNRSVGAFMPIYTAGFIQDKFAFKDLIFRVGVRVERYDANQPVLKDPYSLYPIKTAGEVKELNGTPVTHPSGVGSDYYVYVNNTKNPTSILGYREGNHWFNKDGIQIQDAANIASQTSSGTIQPYLVDPNNQTVTAASFTNYKPQVYALPRVWFDFPISSEARFFANYDVIAQRPDLGASFTPINAYYYLKYNPTNVVNNPALKPQLTTDYEIGFKQKLTDNSGLSLIANYREQRNLVQQYRFNYAYPVTYISYGNIDFSTIKGFRVEYELRDAGNLNIDANYTLQYADGTGSGTNSQQTLISAGQPNLRNLFPLNIDIRHNIKVNLFYSYSNGKRYNGPVVKGKQILANSGVGLILNAFSGIPYTANTIATPRAQSGIVLRSPIKGTPFGSRLPWQLQNDIQVNKFYAVKLGKNKDGVTKHGQLQFTLWVQNFLNLQNIRAVHPYTGSPSTDGYLNSAHGQQAINAAVSSQAFVNLYNTALQNPGYYGLPRRIQLNVKLSF
ncbi:MAG: hypothetical protein GC180_03175 [Bacteroidetes bacterium]|nr:hypothetical protein [Bacteroidota bacterium]